MCPSCDPRSARATPVSPALSTSDEIVRDDATGARDTHLRCMGHRRSATTLVTSASAILSLSLLHCTMDVSIERRHPIPPATGESYELIGPEGGTILHPSGARLVIPPGALAESRRITLS